MCVIDLTHVGEVLVAELLRKNPCIVGNILGIAGKIKEKDYDVFSEISVDHVTIGGEKYFLDGMSRIDVGIIYPNQDGKRICHPIELKLGTDLLGNCKSGIGRFTQGYHTTHNGTRIGGSMISILARKPAVSMSQLEICMRYKSLEPEPNEQTIQVSDKWTLIVRTQKIAGALKEKDGFFIKKSSIKNCRVLSFEELFNDGTVKGAMSALFPSDRNWYEYWGLQ